MIYFVFGLYLSQYDFNILPPTTTQENRLDYFDYRGALNVHTDLSLGSESFPKIALAAKEVGLDFLLITDLNPYYDLKSFETYFDKTLLLNGAKYSYLDTRLNYYSLKNEAVGSEMGDIQIYFSDRLSRKQSENEKDLVWLAHPFNSEYPWTSEIPDGLDGLEIVNLKSLTQQALRSSPVNVFFSLLIYPFNPRLAFMRLFMEPSDELGLFDQVSGQRNFVAFAGSEASSRAVPFPGTILKFPSYQRLFSLLSNHVVLNSELTGQLESDREKIFSALKNGQFYISFDALADSKGFYTRLSDGAKEHMIGSTVSYKEGLSIDVSLPSKPETFFELVLYKNGVREDTSNDFQHKFKLTSPGIYRVQVRVIPDLPLPDAKKWFTWIYTNNFYVK